MNFNRRRSGGIAKKRRSLNRSRLNRQPPSFAGPSTSRAISTSSDDQCIKVVVRARPLNSKETGKGNEILQVVDQNLLVFDPPQDEEDFFFQGKKQQIRDLNKRVNKNIRFLFDRVFDGSSSNEQVFSDAVKPIIDNVLSGFNCSVFAYGATGAGKTFTMLGSEYHPGIIYLIVQELFHRIEEMQNKTCELNISYLEVYNETVKDLLRPSPPLQIRDDSKNVVIAGLSYQKPTSAEHLLSLLKFGNQNRTQHPTDANAESSRSHAVFQIYLKVKDRVGGLSESIQLSKMSLIDLAGSERASVVSNHGRARLREGANINQSLLALGTCINALAAKNGKTLHIPYRNSKLTRILKDSLGGNCRTVMIAAVSPSSLTYEDTYNTLKYAERAKEIKVSLKRNNTHVDAHLSGYKNIVNNLQIEVESLKRKLEEANTQAAKRQKISTSDSSVQTTPVKEMQVVQGVLEKFSSHTLDPDWKETVDNLTNQLMKYRKNILACESNILSSQAREFWRQFAHDRLAVLTADQHKISRSHSKLDTLKKSNTAKADRLTNEKMKNLDKYQEKLEVLDSLLTAESTELEKAYIQSCKSKLEMLALHDQLNHVMELSTSNFKQTHDAWKLCEQALQHARMQQSILKGHGFLTSQLASQFDDLLKQAECGREVAWVDNPPVPNALHQEFLQNLLLPSSGFQTPFPISVQGDPIPLTTYASSPQEGQAVSRDSVCVFAEPSTPPKNSQPPLPELGFASPPQSPLHNVRPEVPKPCQRRCSPHPNKHLSKLSNKELLALITKEDQFVRRSLEETFVAQENSASRPSSEWQPSTPKQKLQNSTLSPVGYAEVLAGGHTLYLSTPCSERPRILDAEACAGVYQQHPVLKSCNTCLLPEPDFHSCIHSEQMMRQSAHCDVGYQQAQGEFCLHNIHKTVPQCSTHLPEVGSPLLTLQHGTNNPMRQPCPATITRPARLAPSQWKQGRVVSVLPSPRNLPGTSQNNQPGLVSGRRLTQGTADRRLVPSKSTGTLRYAPKKENLDPQKSGQKTFRRVISVVQRRPVTPANKLKINPQLKDAK